MQFSGRSESPSARVVDADDLARQMGGAILMPAEDSYLRSQVAWGSREGLRSVHLVTQSPRGSRRSVNMQRGPASMRSIRTMVENACLSNSLDTDTMIDPVFPDSIAHDVEVVVGGAAVASSTLIWPPMRVVMFRSGDLTVLVISPRDEYGRLELIQARGILRRPESPKPTS